MPGELLYQRKSVKFLIKPKLIYILFILHFRWQSSLWRCISLSQLLWFWVVIFFLLCFATDKGRKYLTSTLEDGNAFKTFLPLLYLIKILPETMSNLFSRKSRWLCSLDNRLDSLMLRRSVSRAMSFPQLKCKTKDGICGWGGDEGIRGWLLLGREVQTKNKILECIWKTILQEWEFHQVGGWGEGRCWKSAPDGAKMDYSRWGKMSLSYPWRCIVADVISSVCCRVSQSKCSLGISFGRFHFWCPGRRACWNLSSAGCARTGAQEKSRQQQELAGRSDVFSHFFLLVTTVSNNGLLFLCHSRIWEDQIICKHGWQGPWLSEKMTFCATAGETGFSLRVLPLAASSFYISASCW